MTNTEQIARAWAERHHDNPCFGEDFKAAARFILEKTRPVTMDEITWDNGEHTLAGATHAESGQEVVMVAPAELNRILIYDFRQNSFGAYHRSKFVPNGKRYQIVNADTPTATAAPAETQITAAAFDELPAGSIVAAHDTVYMKLGDERWHQAGVGVAVYSTLIGARGGTGVLLRRGWEGDDNDA